MGQNYPYWNDWYKVAEPLNKIAGLLTIIFSVLWWVLNPIQHTGYNTTLLVESIWRLVLGILAGILYNLLLYRTKDLFACIMAHAVTNLLIGIYVVVTQQWTFW